MFASNGWFSTMIKLQVRTSIASRFDTAGLYVVTNGKIFSVVLAFCLRAECFQEELTSESALSIRYLR